MKKKVFQKENGRRERRKRMAIFFVFFVIGFSALIYRCLTLHLVRDPRLTKIANSQYKAKTDETSPRGNIYDGAGEELAISVPTYSLAVRPGQMKSEMEKTIHALSLILGISAGEIRSKLDGKKYVWLKKNLSPQEKEKLSEAPLPGTELVRGAKRFYPNREVASQILGAVGFDNEGLGGLEVFYDKYLRGDPDQSTTYRDARGQKFETEDALRGAVGQRDPHHLYLTIRKNIQYVTEQELFSACGKYHAKACTAIVVDPQNGQILAMASYPNFNPNSYQNYDFNNWRNRAITDTYEPGSTFKTILAASALENGAAKPSDRFFCENGALKIGDHVIHDHEKYGTLSFQDILKVSSNIGIYKIGTRLGRKPFAQTIGQFGFGTKSGIDYPGEVSGRVPAVKAWQEIEFANIAFGQGIQVTPLQLAMAYAAIANGGTLYRPYLVSRVTDMKGKSVLENRPTATHRVLSEEVSATMRRILSNVTLAGGTATAAALPGYSVAGKTGTAQKIVGGTYSHTKFISSFVGMVPSESPKLVVFVSVDEPQGVVYGGLVAAPVFRQIAWAALRDLQIPPDAKIENSDKTDKVQKALKETKPEKKTPSAPPAPVTEAGLFSPQDFGLGKGIPDFRNLSRRKVESMLEERGLDCEIIGGGIAVAQEPAPGSSVEKGHSCRVYFKAD
jgi:cell division protein FtsI (penicillin-binding protein 3)